MKIPPDFENNQVGNKVCKLKKSIYGLKQAPRARFRKFTHVLKQYNYSQSQADHTLFSKISTQGKHFIFSVYVEDIVITGDDLEKIARLKQILSFKFEVNDLEKL